MLQKSILISATAALFLVGPAPNPLVAAEYKHSGCANAAKVRFPDDPAARKDFKRWCNEQWKIYKKSHKYD
jgi:hypothetical protein